MSLKSKILLILFVASVASAVITGIFLIFLLRLFWEMPIGSGGISVALAAAIGVYLLSGIFILILLNALLSRNVIMPSVERELLEKERKMLTRQLQHSQKMEAVGKLAGSIAHDFNNLLTIIDGYSSMILADPQSSETRKYASEVVEAARKASFITRKLHSFSQKDQAEPVLLDLNTTLQDTQKMLARLIGENITLITKAYHEPVYALADPVQIGQVLMNLAVNARDAMPTGGRITIKIDCRDVASGQFGKPDHLPVGRYAEIAVQDSGTGMDQELIKRIFETFFTTKEEDKGTGLGLSVVKRIMSDNKGFVHVRSRPSNGTTFFLYLPVTEFAAAENPVEEEVEITIDRGQQTILLVEDDPMIRNLVLQALEAKGYKVLSAEEGWEGVKVARTYKGRIDLLFTDVVMPGLCGGELAVAMNELYPGIKVLFMSGYSRAQLVEEEVPGDAALLEKPFTPDQVLAMVRKMLA
jgi:signal transduction histidine kinase